MGLNERRKMNELQQTTLPEREREITEICGTAIPYEVDWESLTDDAQALNYIDNVSCHRLNMALRVICQDDLGKGAVRDGLRLVKLQNVREESAKFAKLDKGVLEMQCAYALGLSGAFSDGEIRKALEDGL